MLPPSFRYEGVVWVPVSPSYVPTTPHRVMYVSTGPKSVMCLLDYILSSVYWTAQCLVATRPHSVTYLLHHTVVLTTRPDSCIYQTTVSCIQYTTRCRVSCRPPAVMYLLDHSVVSLLDYTMSRIQQKKQYRVSENAMSLIKQTISRICQTTRCRVSRDHILSCTQQTTRSLVSPRLQCHPSARPHDVGYPVDHTLSCICQTTRCRVSCILQYCCNVINVL